MLICFVIVTVCVGGRHREFCFGLVEAEMNLTPTCRRLVSQ